jgi:hypothetical protein
MGDIKLTQSQFLEFDQYDQFGFFYDDDGYPREDSDETYKTDVKKLYHQYDFILVTQEDCIYGIKTDKRTLIMENVMEAYMIAVEVIEEIE